LFAETATATAQPSCTVQLGHAYKKTYTSLLVSILFNLQLAVAVAAQDHSVVCFNSKLFSTRWALLALQMLPSLGTREWLENDCDIILSYMCTRMATSNSTASQQQLLQQELI
jgi:hypothetical protein